LFEELAITILMNRKM